MVETDEVGLITLYARPNTETPYISLTQLREGHIKAVSEYTISPYINFSDIGQCVWETAESLVKRPKVKLVKSSDLEESNSWELLINTKKGSFSN